MFNKLHKLAISVVAFGALVLALGGGLASTVIAQPLPPPEPPEPPTPAAATVDSKLGNIHLVKYDNAENAVAGTGAQQGIGKADQKIPVNSQPVDGIHFTLTPITSIPGIEDVSAVLRFIDDKELEELEKFYMEDMEDMEEEADARREAMRKNLRKLATLTGPGVEAALAAKTNGWVSGDAKEGITVNGGKIDWTDLPLGLYLLRETNSIVKQADGTTKAYKKSQASLVFLPSTDPTGDGWLMENPADKNSNYAVWIYPKNSTEENLKTVDDNGKQLGDQITYTISSSIPAVPSDKQKTEGAYDLSNFAFWDHLSEHLQLLDTTSVSVTVGVPTEQGEAPSDAQAVNFVAKVYAGPNADKNVPGTNVDSTTKDGGQKLAVALTSTGVKTVADVKRTHVDAKVFLTFAPTVIKSGVVANKARVYKTYEDEAKSLNTSSIPFNAPKGTNTFETTQAVSVWGKLDILKTDEKGNPISGQQVEDRAKFKIYAADDQGAYNYKGAPVSVNGKSEFETDDSGRLTVDGLHVGTYALVETQAPARHELARKPIEFKIDETDALKTALASEISWSLDEDGNVTTSVNDIRKANEAVAAEMNDAAVLEAADKDHQSLHRKATVVNVKVKQSLPASGGAGIAIFGILGGLLLIGGLYAAKRNSRKSE